MANRHTFTMSRQEAGRKGAEARWGHQEGREDNRGGRPANREGNQEPRQEAGRKGPGARTEHQENQAKRSTTRGGTREQHQEAGRRGAEVRWGRQKNAESQGARSTGRSGNREQHQEIGHKGGQVTYEEYEPEFYEEMSRKRGHALWENDDDYDIEEELSTPQRRGNREQTQEGSRRGFEVGRRDFNEDFAQDEYENEIYSNELEGSSERYQEAKGRDFEADRERDFEDYEEYQSGIYFNELGGNRAPQQRAGRAGASAQREKNANYAYDEDRNEEYNLQGEGGRQEVGRRSRQPVTSRHGSDYEREGSRRGGQSRRDSDQYE